MIGLLIITILPIIILVCSLTFIFCKKYVTWGNIKKKNKIIGYGGSFISITAMSCIILLHNVLPLYETLITWGITALIIVCLLCLTKGKLLYLMSKPRFLKKDRKCALKASDIIGTCPNCSKNCVLYGGKRTCPVLFPEYSVMKGNLWVDGKDTGIKAEMIIHQSDYFPNREFLSVRISQVINPRKPITVRQI
ncbi:MAG: hypothetical protein LBR70_04110 [Lactobacillaceae bacterium]|jgi:hypothetical protein|nr:hypothetical protein [Lactobacillaceae bacterium]